MDDKADETTKTNPTSYKDMIESVSGQLLQPMGILNLVTPKKPKKPKPPKTKTLAKRTSKAAQKAEVIKRKSKADDNAVLDKSPSDDNLAQ